MRNRLPTTNKVIALLVCFFIFWAAGSAAQENEARTQEQLDFANGLFSRSLYEMALTEYQNFIEQHPEGKLTEKAYFGAAESYFFLEDYQKASQAAQAYIAKFPQGGSADVAWLRLGQMNFIKKEYALANSDLLKVRINKLNEKLHQSYFYYLGRTQFELGQIEAAITDLKKAAANTNDTTFTSQSFHYLGRVHAGRKEYEEALKNFQSSLKTADNDQEKAWAMYSIGEVQFLSGTYQDAIQNFGAFIAQYPQHTLKRQAIANLMSSYFNVEDFKSAQDTFTAHVKNDDHLRHDFQTMYILSNAYMRQFQLVQALEAINHALAVKDIPQEDQLKGLSKKVEILIKIKGYQQSLDIIQNQLAPLTQENDELLFFEAESYYGLDQYHAALSTYEKIIKDYPQSQFIDEAKWGQALALKALGENQKALELLEELQSSAPNGTLKEGALYNAVLLNAQLENHENAIALADRYFSEYPDGTHYEKILYLKATLYSKMGDYENAIAGYLKYISDFPNTDRLSEVKFLLAYNQQAAGRVDDALATYQSIQADEKKDKYHYSSLKNSAGIHIKNEEPQKALDYLNRILAEFKDNDLTSSTFIWLGQQFIDKKEYARALEVFEKMPLDNATAKEKAAIAYFKAEALLGNKEHQKAVEQYDLAISLPEGSHYRDAAKVGRANSLQAMERYDEAGNALEEIVESNLQDQEIAIQARFNLGEIEEGQGNLDAAIKYYLLVAVLYDDQDFVPKALFNAGKLLEKQQKPKEALQAYNELVQRYQQNELAKKAHERISTIQTEK